MFGQGSTLHQLSCLLLPGWAPFLFILRLTQVSSNFFSFSLFFSLSLFFPSECPFLFILRLTQVSLFFFIYKHKCHWISLHFYFSPYLKFYKISLNLVSLFSSSENSLNVNEFLFSWKSAQMSLIFISTGRVHEWWEWLTAYVQFWPQREKGFLTKCHFCLTHLQW